MSGGRTLSMTGFASVDGQHADWTWSWDIRAVNGRGLDIRLRLPDWIEGLEAKTRSRLSKALGRGNVTCGLRIQRAETSIAADLNKSALDQTLAHIRTVETAAAEADIGLAPTCAADILAVKGVLDQAQVSDLPEALTVALLTDLETLIASFQSMRAAEGAELETVLAAQVDVISSLTDAAADQIADQADAIGRTFRANLAKIVDADTVDPDRVAQELALLAVKSDVTEEIDRLRGHAKAAKELLSEAGPKGRKLDFLTREFNREANTLCSKAQHAALTRIGLDLKHIIDQMREQVQNVE